MSSKDEPSQVSGHSDDRSTPFYFDFDKGDVGHTLLVGSTRQGKCVQGFTVIAANNGHGHDDSFPDGLKAVAKRNNAKSEVLRLARNQAISAARGNGQTLQEIADAHDITPQRVRQILIGGTLSKLPGTETLSRVTRGLLIRLGYDSTRAILADLKNGQLHFGCTFGMGAGRFSELEAWAREQDSAATSPCRPPAAPEETLRVIANFNRRNHGTD